MDKNSNLIIYTTEDGLTKVDVTIATSEVVSEAYCKLMNVAKIVF